MEGVRWAVRVGAWSPTRAEWLFAARCIQQEEKRRIGEFVFARDAKASMAGRLLIRKLLCEKLKLPWDQIHLQRTPKGKPYLSSPACKWSFNISHQGEYTVLAAEYGLQVGVDVMKTSMPGSGSVSDFFRLMRRQFTDREWGMIESAGTEWKQLDMFYRHWSLKESFIKAVGVGVTFDLRRVEFHVSPVNIQEGCVHHQTKMCLDSGDEEDEGWLFEESLLDPNHHVSVALGREEGLSSEFNCRIRPAQRFSVLSISELLSGAKPLHNEDESFWENFSRREEVPTRHRHT